MIILAMEVYFNLFVDIFMITLKNKGGMTIEEWCKKNGIRKSIMRLYNMEYYKNLCLATEDGGNGFYYISIFPVDSLNLTEVCTCIVLNGIDGLSILESNKFAAISPIS